MNGVLDASVAASCVFTNSSNFFIIGQNADNGQDNYVGLIDNVRLYNRALSAIEVSQLYTFENSTAPFLNFEINLTSYQQRTNRDNGATQITPAPMIVNYHTRDILMILARDELLQGNWSSNSFPKNSELGTDGRGVFVLNGTNILANASDIIGIDFGDNEIVSGTKNDITGLASKTEKKLQILKVTFDDLKVVGGNNLKFYLQGILSQSISDTVPIGGTYTETIKGAMANGAGEGSSGSVRFLCNGSATVTGKTKLKL